MEQSPRRKESGRIRAFRPALGAREAAAVRDAVRGGWLGTGIYTRLFEARLAEVLGARASLATNSGTAALHVALRALDVEGGEVVTTPVTSVATNHAILYNRARPVFCDVERETGNIDPGRLEALVTRRTKAIVVVHLGHACDMDPILSTARRFGVPVVEDACACLAAGGFYKNRPLGTLGDAGTFSFGRFKGLTTIDGGALVHRRAALRPRLERLRRLGHAGDERGLRAAADGVTELGFHYRMNDLCAALGLAQLERRGELEARLDRVLARYRRLLSGVPFLRWPRTEPYSRGARAYAAVEVLGGRRPALRRHMAAHGIELNDVLYPSHLYALYRPFHRALPEAEAYCARTLHLPYYPDLKDAEIDRIAEVVRRFKG
jgi:perosamine synthetase